MAQTWNLLLNYIKREMGANLNFLEMSDDEIVEGIKEDVVPYFSQFVPAKKMAAITPSNIVAFPELYGGTKWTFKIPKDDDEQIIDVVDAVPSRSSSYDYDLAYGTAYEGGSFHVGYSPSSGYTGIFGTGEERFIGESMIDTVIANYYSDMQHYLSVRNTWEFLPPDRITWDVSTSGGTVVYNVNHKELNTIPADMYQKIFKKLCLGHVQRWIAAKRSKYETLATQMGEIRVNWQKLETESQTNIQEAQQLLDLVPLDHFLEIS